MRSCLWLLTLMACGPKAPPTPTPTATATAVDDARAGIVDDQLGDLLASHWAWVMQTRPELATALGDRRFDDRVSDPSPAAADAAFEARRQFLNTAHGLRTLDLSSSDRRFLELFIGSLQAEQAERACQLETWSLSPRHNQLADLFGTLDLQRLDSAEAGEAYLRRIEAWAQAVPVHLDALRTGLAAGRVANRTSTQLVIEMVQRQLDQPTTAWSVVDRDVRGRWASDWRARLEASVDTAVRPALQAYADMLHDEILPAARLDDAPGLASLPDGEACYAARVGRYTTLDDLGAEQIHAVGLEALAGIHAEFRALGPATVGTDDLAAIFSHLRSAPDLRFDSAESIVATAEAALAKAQAAAPDWFGRLPDTPCIVTEIPAYEAPYTTIAYYRQPAPDGSKPGEYFVNTHEPQTRPRHEAEVLAFHEAVPGHHLQIALSYESSAVPAFHRYGGATVFVEGWALYTERLADEMGLYSSDTNRLGMLSFDAWRASRLVVDTGLHQLGWSREQAVDFMLQNTPLAENNVRNEVNRYVTWPGQALAYKTGQLEILELRAEAEAQLGAAFDIRGFHDALLAHGAVSLPLMRTAIEEWVQARRWGRTSTGRA